VDIVPYEPTANSDFEHMFDASDKDTSSVGLTKQIATSADAVAGAKWLQDIYSFVIPCLAFRAAGKWLTRITPECRLTLSANFYDY
jgi:hypothetical protein